MTDTDRIDWLEKMMTPYDNYCEIYLAGLRNWTGNATGVQVESNPQIFKTIIRDTLREAIDTAKKALEATP